MAVKPQTSQDVHAPFNFVPLSEHVFFPDWADQVSQDIPLKDGYCGEIEIELEAKSPLLIGRGAKKIKLGSVEENLVEFMIGPDKNFVIPGSSIKGMIRNVLEIASFGKISNIDDQRYSVRDLQNRDLYTSKMVELIDKKNRGYEAKSKTGWLYIENGKWFLKPCESLRIDRANIAGAIDSSFRSYRKETIQKIKNHSTPDNVRKKLNFELKARLSKILGVNEWPRRKVTTEQIYKAISSVTDADGAIFVTRMNSKPVPVGRGNNKVFIHNKTCYLTSSGEKGYLVMTGMSPTKEREFVFLAADYGPDIELDDDVVNLFQQVMTDKVHPQDRVKSLEGDQRDSPWGYWWGKLSKGLVGSGQKGMPGVPVFFLTDDNGDVKSLGLAQMHKLPYDLSVADMVANTSEDHLSHLPDLADLVLGRVGETATDDSCASRVSFGHANPLGDVEAVDTAIRAVLASPKPTYYPIYVKQSGSETGTLLGAYQTYMSEGGKPTINGWKRYIPHSENCKAPDDPSASVSRLKPLKTGARFRSKVSFHNLKKVELGALLWALFLGGNLVVPSGRVHTFGMGKGIGLGHVSLRATGIKLRKNGDREFQENNLEAEQSACLEAFRQVMDEFLQESWEDSVQVQSLLAMADEDAEHKLGLMLEYMEIEFPDPSARNGKRNQYVSAKKSPAKMLPRVNDRM